MADPFCGTGDTWQAGRVVAKAHQVSRANPTRYRTRKGGRFVMRYRFTQTFSATTYLVRALVRRQSGYSYEEGSSRTIPVPVVP